MLQIKDLQVEYKCRNNVIPAVRGVSFEIHDAQAIALVGESGCGKSTIARAMMGLIPPREGRITNGRIMIDNTDILTSTAKRMQSLRGRQIGMIFQDPFNSLNPLYTVEEQIGECLNVLRRLPRRKKKELLPVIHELLTQVHIPDPERIARSYPHQLSGGLRQRVMIGIAIALKPTLLIADEPTTALDVTIQKGILQLLSELRRSLLMSVLLITHNLAIVANHTERTMVMYAGKIVEDAPTRILFKDPKHPYTQALIASLPRLMSSNPLKAIGGRPPDPVHIPSGCTFHERCPFVHSKCLIEEPGLISIEGRKVRCNLYG